MHSRRVVVVAQRFVQAMPHLAGNDGSRDELGVRMLQAGPGIGAVILENGDVVDALICA
jgi:hypothetical protein